MRNLRQTYAYVVACAYEDGGLWARIVPPIPVCLEELPFLLGQQDSDGLVEIPNNKETDFRVHSLRFEFGHEWSCTEGWRLSRLQPWERIHPTDLTDNGDDSDE